MNQPDIENLLSYRTLSIKPHLTSDEEKLLSSLCQILADQYKCFMPILAEIILDYRIMLGDINEGLDGDACDNLTTIIRILINSHEGNL